MAHMSPRAELSSLDAILDAADADPSLLKAITQQMLRSAGRHAAIALRRGREAPMVNLQLAAVSYSHLVAAAVRRRRTGATPDNVIGLDQEPDGALTAERCKVALDAAVFGDPDGAIAHLRGFVSDKRIERIVDELQAGSPTVAVDRLESLLCDLVSDAETEVRHADT